MVSVIAESHLFFVIFSQVFGFASIILWLCNIYFVFVDTTFYLQWRSNRLGDYGAIDP